MVINQTKLTENLKEISDEMKELYPDKDVSFDKVYISYDGKNEWVDPTTTKKVFDAIIRRIPYKPDDVFIDCGSGLGHVLYLASFYFKKIIGVEIIPDIVIESKKNLLALMDPNDFQNKVQIINHDVLNLDKYIYDQGNIFYIASPFLEKKDFELLLKRIVESIKRKDRIVWIIYYYPYFKDVFLQYDETMQFVTELNLIGDVVIYRHCVDTDS